MGTSPTWGQAPPDADIFLVKITIKPHETRLGKPINLTQRKGYDNQPAFTPDGKGLLYTSIREDGQADIYRYDLQKKTTDQLTQTPESEYSPTVTPDGQHFSVIRVEKDQTQRLWQFPLKDKNESISDRTPALVLPTVKPVGYHCWITADSLALFILGTPNSLQLVRVSSGDTARMAENIGRAIQRVPGKNEVSFVHKPAAGNWEIKQLDLLTRQISLLTLTLEGSEDYVWAPDGSLLMGQGAKLYRWQPGSDRGWKEIADFSAYGVKQLSRLALNPKGTALALVVSIKEAF